MKDSIHKEPNRIAESLNIAFCVYNNKTIKPLNNEKEFIKRIDDSKTLIEFNRIHQLVIELNVFLDSMREKLSSKLEHPYASILFSEKDTPPFLYSIFYYNALFKESTKEESIYDFIIENFSPALELIPSSKEEFTKWIFEIDADDTTKLNLLQIVYNFDDFVTYINSLCAIIKTDYEDLMIKFQPQIALFIEALTIQLKHDGLPFMKDVSLTNSTRNHFYPSIIAPTFLSAYLNTTMNTMNYHIGIFFLYFLEFKKKYQQANETTIPLYKALSDNTKLTILKMLKIRSYYSQELATELSLSGPTISHHMNQLITLDLVTFTTEKRRVYYELNTKQIENLIVYIKQDFLE